MEQRCFALELFWYKSGFAVNKETWKDFFCVPPRAILHFFEVVHIFCFDFTQKWTEPLPLWRLAVDFLQTLLGIILFGYLSIAPVPLISCIASQNSLHVLASFSHVSAAPTRQGAWGWGRCSALPLTPWSGRRNRSNASFGLIILLCSQFLRLTIENFFRSQIC